MKEKNFSLDLNFTYDNYNSIFLLSISVLGLLVLNVASYKFQKDFSNINKPSKIIVCFLASIVFILAALASLVFYDMSNLNNSSTKNQSANLNILNSSNTTINKNSFSAFNNEESIDNNINNQNDNLSNNNNQYALEASSKINFVLGIINFLFYILLPLILFYLIEEKNVNEANNNMGSAAAENYYAAQSNGNKAASAQADEEADNLLNFGSHEINSVHNYPCEFDYLQVLKNFSFYLTSFISLNVIYLILFKTSVLSSANLLEFYSFVPEVMRNYSTLNSEFEILLNLNFLIVFIFSKFSLLIYLPYGMGKLTASLIDHLQQSQELKKEYNNLNSGFNKNFEVIKQITTQKLMTGKSLSKKEKNILRQCKENQTVLEHKQEVLEEKYSKIKAVLFYVLFPLKFFAVILTILIALIIVISKALSAYARLNLSECGVYCGYFTDKVPISIGLQDIWAFILTHSQKVLGIPSQKFLILVISLLYIYLLVNLFVAFRELGLVNLKKLFCSPLESLKKLRVPFNATSEIRSDRILSFLFYSSFFLAAIAALGELLNLSPGISYYMEHFAVCNFKLVDKQECKFSSFMLFAMENSVNFPMGMIIQLGFDLVSTVLTAFLVVYMPIKALMTFSKTEQQRIDTEREFICC